MQHEMVVALGIHVSVIVIYIILALTGVLKSRMRLLCPVLFLPLWGPAMVIFDEAAKRTSIAGTMKINPEGLFPDKKIGSLEIAAGTGFDEAVPLEEAILINDEKTRRKFMLEVVTSDSEKYIKLLEKARLNDDVEVSHYALAAVMEIRKSYEIKLDEQRRIISGGKNKLEAIDEYAEIAERYMKSGLPDENMIVFLRRELAEMLQLHISIDKDDNKTYYHAIDNYIELKDYNAASKLLDVAVEKWPKEEQTWILKIKYCKSIEDGEGVKAAIQYINQKGIKLSPESKEAIKFWQSSGKDNDA